MLLETTDVPVTDVAFAAGFASLRQFNDTVREVFATTPDRAARGDAGAGAATLPSRGRCRCACQLPPAVRRRRRRCAFLGRRAVPGVEAWLDDRACRGVHARRWTCRAGRRVVRLSAGPDGAGYVHAEPGAAPICATSRSPSRAAAGCSTSTPTRWRSEALLGGGPLAGHVAARPGLRVPGAVDGGELAVRAVLGQQISVARRAHPGRPARRRGTAGRSPAPRDGRTRRTFPRAEVLAAADPADLPMPASRARALVELCAALAAGEVVLDGSAERCDAEHRLLRLPGIGPWTAGYIRMRALRDPDVWLGTDLEVVKALRPAGGAPSGGSSSTRRQVVALAFLCRRSTYGPEDRP